MTREQHVATESTRYAAARVARLRPIETAIEKLRLPPNRAVKLRGILNALELQIELGGDSPDVNRLLLEALRAGVRHQVDEGEARAVLRAIDTFERAEAERWQQVRAGTLPPIAVPPEDRLGELMQEGYALLEGQRLLAACDRWLEAWELVKALTRPTWRTTEEFDQTYGLLQSLFNWCQDLEFELGNAGRQNPVYHEHRLRYAREFLSRFSDVNTLFQLNFTRAQAEALWSLGRHAEAEAVFETLVERLPDEAWGYIGWADLYWLERDSPKDLSRAEAILKGALARPRLNDRTDVLQRLVELYGEWGRPDEQAAVAAQLRRPEARAEASRRPPRLAAQPVPVPVGPEPPAQKLSRNAPCWCGSGKKYKRCHLQDESTRR